MKTSFATNSKKVRFDSGIKEENLIFKNVDMDAVELIIKGEMSDISTATLKELRESTGGQTEGS